MTSINEYVLTVILNFLNTLATISPTLLIAIVASLVIRTLVPKKVINYLFSRGIKSIVITTFLGSLIPICSCSILPLIHSLRRSGVPKYSLIPFMIAAPAISLPSILLAITLLGVRFTVIYALTVASIAIMMGLLTSKNYLLSNNEVSKLSLDMRMHHHDHHILNCSRCSLRVSKGEGRLSYLLTEFTELVNDVVPKVLLGLLVASLLALIPTQVLIPYLSYPLGLITSLAIATPMYVCAVGSVPIVATLMSKGLCLGGAIIVLIMGPATNVPSILVSSKVLGKVFTIKYVSLLALITLLLATIINTLMII